VAFWKSFTVIMPASSCAAFTTSSFSMRCWCNTRQHLFLGRIFTHRDETFLRAS